MNDKNDNVKDLNAKKPPAEQARLKLIEEAKKAKGEELKKQYSETNKARQVFQNSKEKLIELTAEYADIENQFPQFTV